MSFSPMKNTDQEIEQILNGGRRENEDIVNFINIPGVEEKNINLKETRRNERGRIEFLNEKKNLGVNDDLFDMKPFKKSTLSTTFSNTNTNSFIENTPFESNNLFSNINTFSNATFENNSAFVENKSINLNDILGISGEPQKSEKLSGKISEKLSGKISEKLPEKFCKNFNNNVISLFNNPTITNRITTPPSNQLFNRIYQHPSSSILFRNPSIYQNSFNMNSYSKLKKRRRLNLNTWSSSFLAFHPSKLSSFEFVHGTVQNETSNKNEGTFLDNFRKYVKNIDFDNITVIELKNIMKEYGLNPNGKKKEMIERIKKTLDNSTKERETVEDDKEFKGCFF